MPGDYNDALPGLLENSEDEEDDLLLAAASGSQQQQRQTRNSLGGRQERLKPVRWADHARDLNEEEFRAVYRMPPVVFFLLLSIIKPHLNLAQAITRWYAAV
jgi:hypothetical protein